MVQTEKMLRAFQRFVWVTVTVGALGAVAAMWFLTRGRSFDTSTSMGFMMVGSLAGLAYALFKRMDDRLNVLEEIARASLPEPPRDACVRGSGERQEVQPPPQTAQSH